MSFLTEDELEGLSVRRLILHVVGDDDDRPFAPEPEIKDMSSAKFFQERVKNVAAAAVHAFSPESTTKTTLERMAKEPDYFVEGAQNLARDFSRLHVEASVGGAFFVFEVKTGVPGTVIYALIKYDYRTACEHTEGEGEPTLRNIVHAFVAEPKAIQKSCLVRVVGGVAEGAVSARDRVKRGSDVTDYFGQFLGVTRNRGDEDLNQNLLEAVRNTLKAVLPREMVRAGFETATAALRTRTLITEDCIRDALLLASGTPTDEKVLAKLEKEIDRNLRREGLAGVEFEPSATILAKVPKRKLETAEGVLITYPGTEENKAVTLERDGTGWRITVTTEKELVTDANLALKAG